MLTKIFLSFAIVVTIAQLTFAQTPGGASKPSFIPNNTPVAYPASGPLNYVRTWDAIMPTTSPTSLSGANPSQARQTTQYYDGLGRTVQTVTKGISPAGHDLVAPVIYDAFGRVQYEYLPYAATEGGGLFKTDPFNSIAAFYGNTTLNPGTQGEAIFYKQTVYEPSPLNRVTSVYAPGNSWAQTPSGGGHPQSKGYFYNSTTDAVQIWDITNATDIPTSGTGNIYAAGALHKDISADEDGNQTIVYTDKLGHAILRKVQLNATPGASHTGWLCTYYVYDDVGNLRFVIPPQAVNQLLNTWTISADIAAGLCYSYHYDERNRMITKKIPGSDLVEMVYDTRDRLVLTRDGNMKALNQWLATFYDGLNRPIMTALYNSAASRDQQQTSINSADNTTQQLSYTIPGTADLELTSHEPGVSLYEATQSVTLEQGFESITGAELLVDINPSATNGVNTITASNPLPGLQQSDLTPLTYNFYDNYNYNGKLSYNTADLGKMQADPSLYPVSLPNTATNMATGMTTGKMVRVMNTDQWLTTSTYYDDNGRLMQAVANNLNSGKDITTTLHSFDNKILATYQHHTNQHSSTNPQELVLTTRNYDQAGHLLSVIERLNDDPSSDHTVATNSYDELGRLKQKQLGITGSNAPLDVLNYQYNIRGWLKSINKDFINSSGSRTNWFGLDISYDEGFTTGQFNGNIAGIKWKSGSDLIARAYGYGYDKADRLSGAEFSQQNSGASAWTKDQMDFTTSNISYDGNGNLLTMNQQGMNGASVTPMDQLTYTYIGNTNQLQAVTDPKVTSNMNLGDFVDGNNGGSIDYVYDHNGNTTQDNNKTISSITYNYLNLPVAINVTGKGSVSYQYDAEGNKLRKTVVDNTGTQPKTITTDYISTFVYENDSLQMIYHDEGRIRPVFKTGQPLSYVYDYFEKDHLGNVRTVLTEQTDFSMYTATMETAAATQENALFSNLDDTRTDKPVGYPADDATPDNKSVAKLNAKDGGKKIGPSLVLKVMAGDTIRMGVRAFYKSQGPVSNQPIPVEDMVAGLAQAFGGAAAGASHGGAEAPVNTTPFNGDFYNNDYQRLRNRDNDPTLQQDRPKAYLNFALFDEQFKLVDANSGVKQVQKTPDELQTLSVEPIVVKKSGYMYVYTSNETQQDVFFDNLAVNLNTGPLLEETHYYPFGLTMAGISSTALKGTSYVENRVKYNGKELQQREFGDGSGLAWYDYGARFYDPQTGRWLVVDPKAESSRKWSPYSYAENNPIRNIDPDGMQVETNFKDKDGNIVKHVQDGSNAVFQQTGEKTALHYEFRGFDADPNGSNQVNLTTAIAEQQLLNLDNPSLYPIDGGATFCNYATQDIMMTVASATDNSDGLLITGTANEMRGKLDASTAWEPTDKQGAADAAAQGQLSMFSEVAEGHGHVATFSVGDNIPQGQIPNVGRHNGFMGLTAADDGLHIFGSGEGLKYYKMSSTIVPKSMPPATDLPKPIAPLQVIPH
jgi:RHS repeat-associated protein